MSSLKHSDIGTSTPYKSDSRQEKNARCNAIRSSVLDSLVVEAEY